MSQNEKWVFWESTKVGKKELHSQQLVLLYPRGLERRAGAYSRVAISWCVNGLFYAVARCGFARLMQNLFHVQSGRRQLALENSSCVILILIQHFQNRIVVEMRKGIDIHILLTRNK